jgi:hypothetical protein
VPLNSNKATFKLLNSQQKQQKSDGKVPHKKQKESGEVKKNNEIFFFIP